MSNNTSLKFKLVDKHPTLNLFRIIAVRDIPEIGVKVGDLGGWVEKESNLARDSGLCWIFGNACVIDNAQVSGNAQVFGNAHVSDTARVFGNARVFGTAHVFDNARVFGNARVFDNACVFGNAQVFGTAQVCGNARIQTGVVKVDLEKDLVTNIKAQTTLVPDYEGNVVCYKYVNPDLSSIHDKNFKYVLNDWVEEPNSDLDPKVSCGKGLHFSHASYWDGNVGADAVLLVCRVNVKDIITVQEGKIRAKRCFVISKAYVG